MDGFAWPASVQTLHRLRVARVDAATQALSQARASLQAADCELAAIRSSLQQMQEEWARRNQAGTIDPGFQRMARFWQAKLRQELAAAQAARSSAQAGHQSCVACWWQSRLALRQLEKHGERITNLARRQAARKAQRANDDNWLGRLAREGRQQ